MKVLRFLCLATLALALAVGLPACSKKTDTQVSMSDTSNIATPPPEAPPAEPVQPSPSSMPPPAAHAHVAAPHHAHGSSAVEAASKTITLPTGATFEAELTTPVSTKTSNIGDKVEGKLLHPLTTADGVMIAPEGALIRGEISDLVRASHAKSEDDRASVKFAFTSLETVDGDKTLAATVTNAEGKMVAKSTSKRDALIIGGSAIAGAVAGKIIGGDTKGTLIGAAGGAVLGTGAVMAAKGYELEIPAGSKIDLRSEAPVTVVSR